MALGEQHAELGRDRDHERAEGDRHRVQRHPHSEQDQRRPAGREHDRHQRHERAAHGRRGRPAAAPARPPRGRRAASPGAATGRRPAEPDCAASTGRPTRLRADPARRVQARAHPFDQLLLAVEAHQADAERERRHAAVGGDHVLGEVRRDRLPAGPVDRAASRGRRVAPGRRSCAGWSLEQVGQRERRAQPRAAAAARVAVAEAREQRCW